MLVFRGVTAGWKNMSWYKGGNASLQNINFGVYPHGNQLIPFQVTFEDVFPFPKVGYVYCIIMHRYRRHIMYMYNYVYIHLFLYADISSGWVMTDVEWTYLFLIFQLTWQVVPVGDSGRIWMSGHMIWQFDIYIYIFIHIFIYSILFIFMNTISNKQTSHHYILSELFQMSEARI